MFVNLSENICILSVSFDLDRERGLSFLLFIIYDLGGWYVITLSRCFMFHNIFFRFRIFLLHKSQIKTQFIFLVSQKNKYTVSGFLRSRRDKKPSKKKDKKKKDGETNSTKEEAKSDV